MMSINQSISVSQNFYVDRNSYCNFRNSPRKHIKVEKNSLDVAAADDDDDADAGDSSVEGQDEGC